MALAIWNTIVTALFPDRCLFCGEVCRPHEICCGACRKKLPYYAPLETVQQDSPFGWTVSPFEYTEGVRRAIGQLKFYGHAEAADFFASAMLEALEKHPSRWQPDWVVPVPMNPQRRKERGYNQAELLSEKIAAGLGCEHRPDALVRTGNVAQHDLSARLRRLEAENSFSLGHTEGITGQNILLVDDVFTTGSTLRRCAFLLLDAGAVSVNCATASVTMKK